MNKYIDAEKLKTELNKRIELLENGDAIPEVMKRVEGVIQGYKATLSIIDALQQEQPEVDLEKEIVSICETYGITKHLDAELGPLDIKNIAHYFYNKFGFNARKEE